METKWTVQFTKFNSMRNFKYLNTVLTEDANPIVIAEIGINHNGSLEDALLLAKKAIDAGAEFVKLQTHIACEEMSNEAKNIIPIHTKENIYDIIESCELTEQEEKEVADYVKSRNANFISTPFSIPAIERVVNLGVPFIKIGSGEFNNIPLIREACLSRLPLILSTGMNNLKSIDKTVDVISKFGNSFALMHCTNLYPTPDNCVRLNAIDEMRKRYPETIIGLSDHTLTSYACFGAIALGASIIERHFTDTKERVGPDISCSMTPNELKEIIDASRILVKQRFGTKELEIKEENSTREFAFASVVSKKSISDGEIFSDLNLTVKRPGNGDFHSSKLESLFGKKASKYIPGNTQLKKEDVC